MVDIKQTKMTKSEIKKKIEQYKKPILKLRPRVVEKQFEEAEFNYDDFSKLDYDSQVVMFNSIKKVFTELKDKAGIADENTYQNLFYNTLAEVLELAVAGNVAAMDYLSFIYKKGVDYFLPINLARSQEWGLLAIANGSRLSMDRMRLFLEPVYEYVVEQGIVDKMIEKNDISDGEGAFFVAQNFAQMYVSETKLDLLTMARKMPIVEDENFQKYLHDAEKKRDEILPNLIKYFI